MESNRLQLGGLWLPLVTPFDAAGAVDTAALQRLVRHLAAQGVAGFVACGSTGEAGMLSEAEQDAVLAATLAASDKPVLMGLAGADAQAIARRARQLADRHADCHASPAPDGGRQRGRLAGWLMAPPAYVKPPQAGIVRHFHTVAEASPLPLVAYDIPGRTGVRIAPATLLALAEHPRIQGLKDCSGDRAAAETVLADGRLQLLAGNDDELFDQLARGAVGSITASAHLATAAFATLVAHLRAGRLAAARPLWRALWPVTQAAFAEPNPMVIKAALAARGWMADVLRLPMDRAAAGSRDALLAAATVAEAMAEASTPGT